MEKISGIFRYSHLNRKLKKFEKFDVIDRSSLRWRKRQMQTKCSLSTLVRVLSTCERGKVDS